MANKTLPLASTSGRTCHIEALKRAPLLRRVGAYLLTHGRGFLEQFLPPSGKTVLEHATAAKSLPAPKE